MGVSFEQTAQSGGVRRRPTFRRRWREVFHIHAAQGAGDEETTLESASGPRTVLEGRRRRREGERSRGVQEYFTE